MMPNLSHIYGDDFFREWGAGHEKYVTGARLITDVLWEIYKPGRLIDLGCGCGVYADGFQKKGASVVAVDGVLPPAAESFPVQLEVRDLTVPMENPWGAFDLALCLDVAEHIPEAFTDVFLQNITRFSDRLILSAAQVGQGGHHHVNERPKRYWVDKLARQGFAYNRKATGRLMETFKVRKPPYMWMCEHISVYERMRTNFPFREDLPFGTRAE
jgi:hypothetical protein